MSAMQVIRTRVSDGRHGWRIATAQPKDRRLAVVYGNCQAEPLRKALERSAEFRSRYRTVRLPPVHEIRSWQCQALAELFARCDLLITQPVRSAYRKLPIGSAEMSARLPSRALVVQFPVLYYEGLHPYQVYVNTGNELSEPAPLTGYHDLRTIATAAGQLKGVHSPLGRWHPNELALHEIAQASRSQLLERERDLDVGVSDLLSPSTGFHDRSFLTVNHPSNAIIDALANRVLQALGLDLAVHPEREEDLQAVSAPVDRDVAALLCLEDARVGSEWLIHGRRIAERDVVRRHLAWYSERPDVVSAGIAQHGARLETLGLL